MHLTTSATLPAPSLQLHQPATSFLKPILLCFLQLVPSISSSVSPVYIFHPLYVPLPSSQHLSLDCTTLCHSPLPAYLHLSSIPMFLGHLPPGDILPVIYPLGIYPLVTLLTTTPWNMTKLG